MDSAMKSLATNNLNNAIDSLRQAMPELLAVYRFGSAGTEYERPSSDIDLAFLSPRAEDPVTVWNTAQAVAIKMGRDVDLVDLHQASTVIAANIIAHGTRLFCTDTNKCAEFEAYALADYARLNEERRGILNDIQTRGSVYAR